MIVILADDFSGAAELAGIAAARGFQTELHTRFDPASDAEVIAVDTDTRLRTEAEAARLTGRLAREIAERRPDWIYKKTDSVLRGHVRAEIEAILDATGLRECLLIPANPSKDRLIRDGRYFVAGVPLEQTVFAHDPDFPRHTSLVTELLGVSPRIRLPDAVTLDDLRQPASPSVLRAGGADFFSLTLATASPSAPAEPLPSVPARRHLLLCGSLAAWEMGRAEEMQKRGFLVRLCDQPSSNDLWRHSDQIMLATGPEQKDAGALLISQLIEAALPLLANGQDLRVGVEGGATASALVRRLGWTRFEVLPENQPGIGTLRSPGGPLICVKPGSYPWPADLWR